MNKTNIMFIFFLTAATILFIRYIQQQKKDCRAAHGFYFDGKCL